MLMLLALLWLPHDAAFAQPALLLVENGAQYSFKDGVHQLERSGGWLRSRDVFLDFLLEFEYRGVSQETDAGVVIRGSTARNEWPFKGVRLALPTANDANGRSILQGIKEEFRVLEDGSVVLRPGDEWQKVRISGEGRRLAVIVNDRLAGVFEIERFGGYLLFENLKGTVQLRNMRMQATDQDFSMPDGAMTAADLKKAGGTLPTMIHYVRPNLTREAWEQYKDRRVTLEMIVLADGSTGSVRATQSPDPAVDLALIAAMKAWRHTPAVLDGKPVAALVKVAFRLTLKMSIPISTYRMSSGARSRMARGAAVASNVAPDRRGRRRDDPSLTGGRG